ncbi:MAG: PAS domain-containing protein [Armatimonadota bacterium]|nr:PAS domain-containing protein [Armatimonadota bacterium]MDR7485936.1 PAS domain-containing protein [Armatimonadota bacterium]MDR7533830.1 PAS domain-containing protein [Armatimonadota bacterium]MDR7536641.1 PAS domain-containing protein [Armatimonadota bacterium]
MVQKEIELILMRQLAASLATPIFVVDRAGTLVYFNEPAEALLGRRYDEAGEMPFEEWSTIFTPRDDTGARLPPEVLPLAIALRARRPAHRGIHITGLDGVDRQIEVVAFPLEGQAGRHLGAVAIFWERAP